MKAIIFDADGMVVLGERFSKRYQKEFNIPEEEMNLFFEGFLRECTVGRADLKKVIKPFFRRWKWKKSLKEFLDYWFSGNYLDEKIIKQIKRFRKKGIKCYLATNQEKYRTEYFRKKLGLHEVFDKIYSSCEIGYPKSSREFFQFVLEDLKKEINIEPKEIMFWDDEEKNILLAKEFGFESLIYKNIENFRNVVLNKSDNNY